MSRPDADRNLLFGINALQNDFITRNALIAAMNAWVLEKHRPLGEILVERGNLSPADRSLLDQLIERHLARYGGHAAASLAAMSSIDSVADDLRRAVADPDVLESIAHVSPESQADPHATRAPEPADYIPTSIRFRKVRDHAEGGLGIVFVARDEELNREVALKEIKPKYADNLASQARFLLEAEITGGLEHPGIVPVYGLGHYDDGRPYYAMRFIRGNSLKDALAAFHADASLKNDPGARTLALQKLLRRFLDVCNAVAYAHNRGVLHRDLKPDNVMVGKYGETLVVDWGLAKTVGRSGDDGLGPLPESTLMYKSSSGSAGTMPGSVIGTPGYMSPEQAAGRLDLLGPTSDVYSLGATLYTLLTGRVAFEGKDLAEVLRKVEQGTFPRPRDASPWIDPALEAICLKAMAIRPEDRYPSPRAIAEDLELCLADEPVSAFREHWTGRVRRWARKHRTAVTTCASTALVASTLLFVYGWVLNDRERRADSAALVSLAKADQLEDVARATSDLAKWSAAVADVRRAEAQLESGGGSQALRRRAKARIASLEAEEAQCRDALRAEERDRRVVLELDEARLLRSNEKDGHFDFEAEEEATLNAFRSYEIDLETLPIEEAAKRVRSSRVARRLVAALDEWWMDRPKSVLRGRLETIARAADPDPEMAAIREMTARKDAAGLRRLIESEEARRRLKGRLRPIFSALARLELKASLPLLETIRREDPADFWFNHDLADAYLSTRPPDIENAIRYFIAAVAIRPGSTGIHNNLGNTLRDKGELDAAIAELREAIRLKPTNAKAHSNLGAALQDKGEVDGAIAECREAIRLMPGYADAHINLGVALLDKTDLDGSIFEDREAIRLMPGYAEAHNNLGVALHDKGELDAAIAEYREATRLNPEYYSAFKNLGNALSDKGEPEAALAAYRDAIRLKADYAEARTALALLLRNRGEIDAAIAECRESIKLAPRHAETHNILGTILRIKGDVEAAIHAFREAIRLDSHHAVAHSNLGATLLLKGDLVEGIEESRAAIRSDPKLAEAHCGLGFALELRGRFDEALKSFVRGHDLGSRRLNWPFDSAKWIKDCQRLIELDDRLPAILKGETAPDGGPVERLDLARLCRFKSLPAASTRFYEAAFAVRADLAEDLSTSRRYDAACSAALAGSGKGDDPQPDEATRSSFREKARAWLRADLAAWVKVLDGDGRPASRMGVAAALANWKVDCDLAGVRDEAGLAKLPEGEREACRALWAEVDRLLAKARAGSP